jgi:hypothetical protein
MKSIILFSIFTVLVSCTSYWDSNDCADTNIVVPSNTSSAIMYMFENPDQEKVFTYEYFQSELTPGLAVEGGDIDFMRPNDYNLQCGVVFY